MKLISNLDVNGNKFINGSLTLQMPNVTGEKTIATHEEVEEVIAQFGGAFQFKGEAIRIKETEGVRDYTTIIVAGEGSTEVEIKAASTNRGNVYQISDKEYASNGSVWVELGFNIDLSAYDKTADALAREATLDGKISTNATAISGLDTRLTAAEGKITTAESDIDALEGRMTAAEGDIDALETSVTTLQSDLEEAEEVTSAALNDLNSRANGHDSDISGLQTSVNGLDTRLTAAESAISSLDGDVVKSVAFGEGTAIEPDENGKVTLTAATDEADGYMTATDHVKLTGIAAGAQVNVIEGVKLDGAAGVLPLTDKVATIPNASANGNGLMTASDYTKLSNVEAGAEVNIIKVVKVNGTALPVDSSDRSVNVVMPAAMAVAYLQTITTAQDNNTVTITKATHGCGNYPLVQVFAGNEVVSANVTVDTTVGGDVTVSWAGIDPTQTAIRIRIVGCPTETQAQS